MKVTLSEESQEKKIEFPKLMINTSTGTIVLFESKKNGVVLFSNSLIKIIGTFNTEWIVENFSDYTGSITLSNN